MVDPGFYATVRKMIAEHPFVPTTGNEKVRNCEREKSRQYEQSGKRREYSKRFYEHLKAEISERRKKNKAKAKERNKKWREANPEKVKLYQERNKKNVKAWAEAHPERIRELGRIHDRNRRNSPGRKAWKKEYAQRPEVKKRLHEYDHSRNQTPERKAQNRASKERQKIRKKGAALFALLCNIQPIRNSKITWEK